jgi:hypothetical protein
MGTVPPQLQLIESITVADHAAVAVGSGVGGKYLVVELPGMAGPCWVCAPCTDRALDCVRRGRTSAWTVLHHSCTGTVEIFRTAADGSLHYSVTLCSRLPAVWPERAAA